VKASASAKWNGMSARAKPPIVSGPLAATQPSRRPPWIAAWVPAHEWSRSATHCALVRDVSMRNGHSVDAPEVCWNTLRPLVITSADGSPYPRTPCSVPK
jgi:hypothetical protein